MEINYSYEEEIYTPKPNFYPNNIAESEKTKGIGTQAKLYIFLGISSIAIIFITKFMLDQFSSSPYKFLYGLLGFSLGCVVAYMVYSILFIDPNKQKNESSTKSKTHKFLKVSSYGVSDEGKTKAQLFRYASTDTAIMLSLHPGVYTLETHRVTAEFLEKIFAFCYSQNIKFKPFTLEERWTGSKPRDRYYNDINTLEDELLKSTLIDIDRFNTPQYDKMKSTEQVIIFHTPQAQCNKLDAIYDIVQNFIEVSYPKSNLRDIYFNDETGIFEKLPKFLTLDLSDAGEILINKENITIDTRSLIDLDIDIKIDTLAKEVKLR